MLSIPAIGSVSVVTTSNRGWTPSECAERFVARLVSVSETAPEPVRAQALVYRDRVYRLAVHHMSEAARSERTTIINQLRDAGLDDAARLIERI
jgi:hypothetical protein